MSHTSDKLCYGVECFIVHGDKVLLRMHDKYHYWCSIGGHIEPGEDPLEALHREVSEETGLVVTLLNAQNFVSHDETRDLPAPNFLNRHWLSDGHEHLTLVYIAITQTTHIHPGEGEKPVECKWFTLEEVANPQVFLKDNIRYYAQQAIKLTRKQ